MILTVQQSGEYRLQGFGLSTKFEDDMIDIQKWDPEKPMSAIYYDGDKKIYMIKRFLVEKSTKPVRFIPEGEKVRLEIHLMDWKPKIEVTYRKQKGEEEAKKEEIVVEDFISVTGLKAKGNTLTKDTVTAIDRLEPIPYEPPTKEGDPPTDDGEKEAEEAADSESSTTVELEVENTTTEEKPKWRKKYLRRRNRKRTIRPHLQPQSQTMTGNLDSSNRYEPLQSNYLRLHLLVAR